MATGRLVAKRIPHFGQRQRVVRCSVLRGRIKREILCLLDEVQLLPEHTCKFTASVPISCRPAVAINSCPTIPLLALSVVPPENLTTACTGLSISSIGREKSIAISITKLLLPAVHLCPSHSFITQTLPPKQVTRHRTPTGAMKTPAITLLLTMLIIYSALPVIEAHPVLASFNSVQQPTRCGFWDTTKCIATCVFSLPPREREF